MFLPYRNQNPPESFPYGTVGLMIANVVTYCLTTDYGMVIKKSVALQGGMSMAHFHPYQFFTSMFLHGEPMHLLGNMWFLYLFGFAVEGRMRTPKFLLLYFLSGIIGGATHLLIAGRTSPDVPIIGASGAIMGVMGAAIYMFPFAPVDVFWTFFYRIGRSVWKLWWVGGYFIFFDLLYATVTQVAGVSMGVANLAHLGGVASGALIAWIMRIKRDDESVSDAKATLYVDKHAMNLSEYDLQRVVEQNPNRTDLIVQWLNKSIYGGGPTHYGYGRTRNEAIHAFKTHFSKIVTNEPIQYLCHTVNALLMTAPEVLTPRELGQLAARAEREGMHADSFKYYQRIVNDARATQSDVEGAAFRVAMLLETQFHDFAQAQQWYTYIKQRFPMSPIITQVDARLNLLARSTPKP